MTQDECLHTAWLHVHECSFQETRRSSGGMNRHGPPKRFITRSSLRQSETRWKNELPRNTTTESAEVDRSLDINRASIHAFFFFVRWSLMRDVHLPRSISSARLLVWQLLYPRSSWCAKLRRSPSSARTSALGSWAGTWSERPVHCEEKNTKLSSNYEIMLSICDLMLE